jgi:hypothetical protein
VTLATLERRPLSNFAADTVRAPTLNAALN